jgi:hypothetical protein
MQCALPRLIGLFIALTLISGCGTTRIAKTEEVAGMVIDAQTLQPIEGARVMFVDRKDTLTTTDAGGDFICGPGYMEIPIRLDFQLTFGPETRLQVSAKGYQTTVVQAYPRVEWTHKSQMPLPKVLVVRLEPAG